jgi:hypothetical protein
MKVYISCGAGDFIAIESFLTDEEKQGITEFYLFTRAASVIKELISFHPIWKDCKINIPYTQEQIRALDTYSFFDIKHLKAKTRKSWPELDSVIDYSGEVLYPQILSGSRKFNKSEFEIDAIPCEVVLDAESNNDDRMIPKGRNLTSAELGKVNHMFPDLQITHVGLGLTELKEALGLVKGCQHFIGVDSMLACWAARQDTIQTINVKTINHIYVKWLPIYDPFKKIKVVGGFV